MVCKECERRELGCHSTCEDYLRFREENLKRYEKRRMETEALAMTAESVKRARRGKIKQR